MKKTSFKDKVVIVTGSSQGIGKETAKQFAQQGARVVINGRSKEKLLNTQREFASMDLPVLAVQADITNIEDCERMIETTIGAYGRLDILINNGSLTMNEQFDSLDPELFQQIFISNSMGAVIPTQLALPYIRANKGSVLFISSLAGCKGLPSASAYSMGKMSLTALWQSLRFELVNTGVHFGICYVSFTENETGKRMVTSDGKLIPVPKRSSLLLQSRERVARSIVRMIKYRRPKRVLSTFGKVVIFLFTYFPTTVDRLIRLVQRVKQKKGALKERPI